MALAKQSLVSAQVTMKTRFDMKAKGGQFRPGDKALMLLPMPGAALSAPFSGTYVVDRRVFDTDYIISTHERRQTLFVT